MDKYGICLEKVKKYGQEQLLARFEELNDKEKETLADDILSIDFELVTGLYNNIKSGNTPAGANFTEISPLPCLDTERLSESEKEKLTKLGLEAIGRGEAAVLTMAGGQGTRLGHTGPKGTYDIGLPDHKSLFEMQCDSLKRTGRKCGYYPQWYIMTSDINHDETCAFFEANYCFGYPKDKITFFRQTMIPAITSDGLMHLSDRTTVLKSPNGNGGMFVSLKNTGNLSKMAASGVKYLFVCGIDNVLIKPCDPLFLGAKLSENGRYPASAKSYIKRGPGEKAGIFCKRDGKPGVLEYTEIPSDLASLKDENGTWVYGDTNVLSYVFDIDAVEKLASAGIDYHVAVKKLTFIDEKTGEQVNVTGGYKFELFLFDTFMTLDDLQVVRVSRTEEFAPVKNVTGEDSAELARTMVLENRAKDPQRWNNGIIDMKTPLVEMDGDEMTRIIWQKIKDTVICPFVNLKTEYYDLGIENRDRTEDRVTKESAEATKKYGVAVKCATITPNAQRVQEFGLHSMWKSPNATIRAALDGTVFRKPILCPGIDPLVKNWKKPITIARHAYGDIYSAVEAAVPQGGKAELVITDKDGNETRKLIKDYASSDGIVMGMHNLDKSIESFAESCFTYALNEGIDLWFSAKDTISKVYDHRFKDIFNEIYENKYKKLFEAKGISFFYTLVDDAIARVMKSEGGFLWACKNYDGDVFSDMLATSFGSLAMMTSVLVSPKGYYEYEAAHGTIPRHYHKYLNGEKTSTNPVATLFAWTGALRKRGELDGTYELSHFARRVEKATMDALKEGYMTGDLALLSEAENKTVLDLDGFLKEIAGRL